MKRLRIFLALTLCLLLVPALASALEVEFSHGSGFYDDTLTLTIECDNRKATIHYTLDGTVPDETSPVYEGPLMLTDSSLRADSLMRIGGTNSAEEYIPTKDFPTARVVRAVAIAPNGKKSEVVSGTYFVGYDRKQLYGDTAIVCLVTDPANLFDYEKGIYVLGKIYDQWAPQQTEAFEDWQAQGNFTQHGDDWERPVSVTFLSANGTSHTQEMGMRIKGGASRGHHQKSLRLVAREEYGEKNVKYAIYPDNICEADGKLLEKYKSVTLRNGGNDTYFAKIRDPYITNLASGMRFETAANMPVIAFINGEYWGVYILNEEYSDKYIQYHYGTDDNNVIIVKNSALDEGEEKDFRLFQEMYDFIAWEDMEDPAVYAKACDMLDMSSFADYWAVQLYIVNEDGPAANNNWQMWRVRTPEPKTHPYADGKWRMMLFDTDYSSGIYTGGGGYDQDNISGVLYGDFEEYSPALMLQNLMLSEDFRREFLRACCDVSNLYFSADRTAETLNAMRAQYEPYIPDSLLRFGPQWVTWEPAQHTENNLNNLDLFFRQRASSFLDVVQKALGLNYPVRITIKINDDQLGQVYVNGRDVPVVSNSRIDVFAECGMSVTAVPAKGATFTGWTVSQPSVVLEDPDALTTEVTFSRMFTLTANFG